jgi:GAF domain
MTGNSWKMKKREDDARLEAAQKRLLESMDQADAIEAIREIVTNLLGCEEIGLFTVGHGNERNSGLLWSFGIDPQQHKTLDAFEPSALHRVREGELHIAKATPDGHGNHETRPLRAFVPICLDGRTVAVLVMFKLLPQKLGFDEADIRLVKLLSSEAGRRLFERSENANA